MRRLITLDISPATATHCGDGRGRCDLLDPTWPCCNAYRHANHPELDHDTFQYKRLPECIAAEQNAAQDKQAEKAQP